jgi:hypothetical protein
LSGSTCAKAIYGKTRAEVASVKGNVKQATYEGYARMVRNHIDAALAV